MRTNIYILFLSLLFISTAYADNNKKINYLVLQQAQVQKELCAGKVEQIQSYQQRYFVWYHTEGSMIDKECNVGSGTGSYHLAEVRFSGKRPVIVKLDWLDKLLPNINNKIIQNPHISPKGILSFQHFDYGENDPSCCMSQSYLSEIRLSDMRVLSTRYLGQDKTTD